MIVAFCSLLALALVQSTFASFLSLNLSGRHQPPVNIFHEPRHFSEDQYHMDELWEIVQRSVYQAFISSREEKQH